MANSPKSKWLNQLVTVFFSLALFTSCSLISYREDLNQGALILASNAASEVSQANLMGYLGNFNQSRFFLDDQIAIQNCEDYLINSLTGMGYPAGSIRTQAVQLNAISLFDTKTGLWTTLTGPFFQNNIIATKLGSEPSLPPILVGAHYDSVRWGPGANDNGSGCSAILELARILQAKPLKRTVVMVFFAFEETGLQGSQHYVASLSEAEIPKVAYILDTIGFTSAEETAIPFLPVPKTGDFLAVISAQNYRRPIALFQQLNAAIATGLPVLGINADNNVSSNLISSNLLRSDHWPFWLRGCPALFITDTADFRVGSHYHQSGDTADTVNFGFLEKVVRAIVANVAYSAAE